ncbi:unnamed protein product [Hydatigera taeniaeformis]|uniref:Tick transposon n=1 Tax=Hydatigena taeniaeformis TaxID=6205 RepID=A0A0R3WIZ1_HYDTA|nr:unnamed protein product [Hydatigera taeniaeformis]
MLTTLRHDVCCNNNGGECIHSASGYCWGQSVHKARRMAERLNDVTTTCAVSFYDDRVSEHNGGTAVPLYLLQPNYPSFNLSKVNLIKELHDTVSNRNV